MQGPPVTESRARLRLGKPLSLLVLIPLLAGACGSGAPISGMPTGTPARTPSPTLLATPTTFSSPPARPTVGACVTGEDLRAVPCDSSEAKYRIWKTGFISLDCEGSAYVESLAAIPPYYCLDPPPGHSGIEHDVHAGDCIILAGVGIVSDLHVVDCTDSKATHRELSILQNVIPGGEQCPAASDDSVDFGIGITRTLCLQSL